MIYVFSSAFAMLNKMSSYAIMGPRCIKFGGKENRKNVIIHTILVQAVCCSLGVHTLGECMVMIKHTFCYHCT